MAVSSVTNRVGYQGNGSSASFAFGFRLHSASDLGVFVYNSSLPTANIIQALALNAGGPLGFTFAGSANNQGIYESGGVVVFNSTPNAQAQVVIFRSSAVVNNFSVPQFGGIPATSLNNELDLLTLIAQRAQDLNTRAMKLADGFGAAFDPNLPPNLNIVGSSVLMTKGDGTGFTMGPTADQIFSAASSAILAAASAAAAAVSAGQAAAETILANSAALSASNSAFNANSAAVSLGNAVSLIGSTAFWGAEAQSSALSAFNSQILAGSAAVSAGAQAVLATAQALLAGSAAVSATNQAVSAGAQAVLSASAALSAAQSAASLPQNLVNYIGNAEFRFWQRQVPGTLTAKGDDLYGPDRWYYLTSGSSVSGARVAEIIGSSPTPFVGQFRQAHGSSSQIAVAQIIESDTAINLRGKTVSLSFFARTDGTEVQNIRAGIVEISATADVVTSDFVATWGSTFVLVGSSAFANTPSDLPLDGSMRQYQLNATLGNSFNNLAVVMWTPNAEAQNDDFYLSQVQLVQSLNPFSWPLIRKDFATDLINCQRYYEKSYNVDISPGTASSGSGAFGAIAFFNADSAGSRNVFGTAQFITRKRTTIPSVQFYNPVTGAVGGARSGSGTDLGVDTVGISGVGPGQMSANFRITNVPAQDAGYTHITADSEL